ncbi:lipolytic enzyme [Colletotrichum tofieldiae]|uniref:Lipolytic enzyme (GDSL-like Lipase/Acylhydrolase) n=1 Tax=Colletotrichum tofieldiae TaxID=708197 RepID=A0A166UP11_9PEZI|nr:lipolytic enzyme (GDSL-like Lipase/Acylhydrolase) [Colletotrichum tofieldiae]GKT64215.1 lipolytic enzyme [Colletotrichum tofieldiae]GKT74165.1 lipolytic enzyme [Colletotrichum tofieldiae]GKT97112.1 lipolytic enzyme [Colletotrichum tofieldiae]
MLSFVNLLLWATFALSIPTRENIQERQDDNHWVATWTSMPQEVEPENLPPSPYSGRTAQCADATLRQTFHVSVGASRLRIQLSNTFGGSDLPITAASIALPINGAAGVSGINTSTLKGLTFSGSPSVVVKKGAVVYSDPVNFTIAPQTNVALSLYSQQGQSGTRIVGHPGSRTTSWMQAGNKVNASSVAGASTKHWYFASAVEAWAPRSTSNMIILGDSITDGRGSDDDKNNRWPDLLLARMHKQNITNIAIGNQAAGGNAVLSGGLGPTLLSRYTRDALTQQGVSHVLVFEGVNDIGPSAVDAGSQQRIGDGLINAYKQIAADCKKAGFVTVGATITPFAGNGQSYSNPAREQTRVRVNKWILESGTFDHVVDFAGFIGEGDRLKAQFDGGDHLHPNVAGYQEMANRFPLDIFGD